MKNFYIIIKPILAFIFILTTYIFTYTISTLLNFNFNLISKSLIAYIIGLTLPCILLILKYKLRINFKFNLMETIICMLLGVAIQPFGMFLSSIGSFFSPTNVSIDMINSFMNYNIFIFIIYIALIPAIIEELTFRGTIFNITRKFLDLKYSILITSILFGIMHFNIQQFIYASVLGVFLNLVYCKTNNIFSSITIHFTINSTQALVILMMNKNSQIVSTSNTSITLAQKFECIMVLGIISIILYPCIRSLYNKLSMN